MARQLTLIDITEREWHLDDETREIGRRGIAQAREALALARAAAHTDHATRDAA